MMNLLRKVLGGKGTAPETSFSPPYAEINEPTSMSNFQEVLMNHMNFHFVPDFERKVLRGSAIYEATYIHCERTEKRASVEDPGPLFVTLDTRNLTIEKVMFIPFKKSSALKKMNPGDEDPKDAIPLKFDLGLEHAAFGTPLKITLPEAFVNSLRKDASKRQGTKVKQDFCLKIVYETATEGVCTAIQWLNPEQTKDKKLPFLFTQCQAIHCRSMLPCQDAPACKSTYSATVVVPKDFTALMSAESVGQEVDEASGAVSYHFEQAVPMSPYLIAMVAGFLESMEIGPRTRVWAEPSMVKECGYEFEETEQYLVAAEQICGPYVWGRYDLLVLPPSFPYGGMENPCLTFVTPTLLAGDRSLSNVVAHEIAHSWMGNLVTNASWEDFWLNEGFTVWVERRIIGKVFGKELETLKAAIGWSVLEKSVASIGPEHPFTQLHIPMEGIDPDDSFSSIPYEKGFAFLCYLEKLVGGAKFFEPFIIEHVKQFQFNTVQVNEWKSFFIDYFRRILPPATLNEINWDAWLHQPGMPPIEKPDFASKLLERVTQSANEWTSSGASAATRGQVTIWSTDEKLLFLERLLSNMAENKDCRPIMKKAYEKIDDLHNFSSSRNSEVRFLWYTLGVRLRREKVFAGAAEFLKEQGRMKFVRPLYRDLFVSCNTGRKIALETFKANASGYHSIARRLIAKDLHVDLNGNPVEKREKRSPRKGHRKGGSKSASKEKNSTG